MARGTIPADEFIRLFELKGARGAAKEIGVDERTVYARRRNLEKSMDIIINAPSTGIQQRNQSRSVRKNIKVKDGTVLIGSDAHYWKDISTAHLAFVDVCKRLKPVVVIANGDMLDGASISRFPPINWEGVPSLADELEFNKARLGEIVKASKKAKHYWTLGNHDSRFESKLASVAPEFAGIVGVHLNDHFPGWISTMSIFINDSVVVKHRFKGGIHARHNNTVHSGKTIVTGHTHQQGVTPWTDYNGTRYGVESGTMAEPNGAQFEYTEDNPKNWVSGFAVLTFAGGELMQPELVKVVSEGVYEFRGERREVSV